MRSGDLTTLAVDQIAPRWAQRDADAAIRGATGLPSHARDRACMALVSYTGALSSEQAIGIGLEQVQTRADVLAVIVKR